VRSQDAEDYEHRRQEDDPARAAGDRAALSGASHHFSLIQLDEHVFQSGSQHDELREASAQTGKERWYHPLRLAGSLATTGVLRPPWLLLDPRLVLECSRSSSEPPTSSRWKTVGVALEQLV